MGTKFNWGAALQSAGSDLGRYADQRRQEQALAAQRAYEEQLWNERQSRQEKFRLDNAATARQQSLADDPFMPVGPDIATAYGISPTRSAAVGPVPSLPVPAMRRQSQLVTMMNSLPEPPKPEKPVEQWSDPYEMLVGGKTALVRKNLATGKVEQVTSYSPPAGGGGSASGSDQKPQWFDPYGQPRYDPMTEADKLYYMIDHGFQTAGALAGGKQDWSNVLIDPASVEDVDAFRGGKFYDTKPGILRDKELEDEDVRAKFDNYISSSNDPDMAYASIVRALKAMKADEDAIRRVLPEYHGMTFDQIRARAAARQSAPQVGGEYPPALIAAAAKDGMKVGTYEGKIGAWSGTKFYPWEGE